jgi:hypothetical protein
VSAQTLNNPAHATALLATRRVIESGPVGSAPRPWDMGALQRRRPETYVPKDTMRLPGIGPHDDGY